MSVSRPGLAGGWEIIGDAIAGVDFHPEMRAPTGLLFDGGEVEFFDIHRKAALAQVITRSLWASSWQALQAGCAQSHRV